MRSPAGRWGSTPADPDRRPQTNGKAERFIRTMLGGWAYGAIYRSSAERTAALEGWLWRYNYRRNTAPSAESRPQLASPS